MAVEFGLADDGEEEEEGEEEGARDWKEEDKEKRDVWGTRVVGFIYDGLGGLLEGCEKGVHTVLGDEEKGGVWVEDGGRGFWKE